jgi:two-component system cell cycle sensor histidine kinase/response regulator CckA
MKVLPSGVETSESEPFDTTRPDLRGTETILVVEDDRMMRELLVVVLEQFGYQVVSAADGSAAIDAAARFGAPIHLILSDVVMPRMSGVELVASVRRWYPGVGVLLMSGYPEGATAAFSLDEELIFFIRKPFTIPALVGAVHSALDSRPHVIAG